MREILENSGLIIGIDYREDKLQAAWYDEEAYQPVCEEASGTFEECIGRIREKFPEQNIAVITVSIKDYSKSKAKEITDLLVEAGCKKDIVHVISSKQSYMYYVLSQNREFSMNDVGLFDYDTDGLKYYQLTIDRRKEPYIIGIIEKEYSDMLAYDERAFEADESLKFVFENVCENAIHKQYISTLYMTGAGFDGTWADNSMKKMCQGRRVFKGQNLYVQGACYASRSFVKKDRLPDFIFIDEEMIPVHISTSVYVGAAVNELIIARAGSVWNETDNSIYIIPDKENELQINISNVISKEKNTHIIPIDFVGEKRLDMLTRLRIRVRFQSVNKCIITISDEGFGEILESSRKVCERIIEF